MNPRHKRTPTLRAPGLGVLVLILAAALVGCSGSSTSLVNMWKDPSYAEPPMKKVLVVAVKKDPGLRRIWEDGFVAEISERATTAVPSYQLFPDALPDTLQVLEAVRAQGFDGVITTHKLGTETTTRYVPGYVTTIPATGYDPWYGAYFSYYRRVHEPGYTETQQVIRYQTDVWDVRGKGRLVWTGTSESIDPSSSVAVNREISDKIAPELAKQGILPAKK